MGPKWVVLQLLMGFRIVFSELGLNLEWFLGTLGAGPFTPGLCKSKWERIGRLPSGSHEYIDVNTAGTRYIIEVNLASEFEIATPTETYTSLLQLFPPIFVGEVEELKQQVVRLICNAIKHSTERVGSLGTCRPSDSVLTSEPSMKLQLKRARILVPRRDRFGYVPLPEISYHCREDFHFAIKAGLKLKVGQLAIAFDGHQHASLNFDTKLKNKGWLM